MMSLGRRSVPFSAPSSSCSQTMSLRVALRGAAYVMSRSMHSSTEYFGSPSAALTYSRVKFSLTSEMGKISPNTRSRPKSHCSSGSGADSTSFSNERSWTSSRFGIGITDLSLAKLTTGRLSLRSSNVLPPYRMTRTGRAPGVSGSTSGTSARIPAPRTHPPSGGAHGGDPRVLSVTASPRVSRGRRPDFGDVAVHARTGGASGPATSAPPMRRLPPAWPSWPLRLPSTRLPSRCSARRPPGPWPP